MNSKILSVHLFQEKPNAKAVTNPKWYATFLSKAETKTSILFRRMCTLPLHFFGIAGNEEAQGPFFHLDMVTRVYERAVGRVNHVMFGTG